MCNAAIVKLPRQANIFTNSLWRDFLDIPWHVLADFSRHQLAFGEDLGLAHGPLLVEYDLAVNDPAFFLDFFFAANLFGNLT